MYEAMKRILRGRHNSIRYKYGTLPKEWLTYFYYRMCGRSWAEFYAQRLDGYIDLSKAKMPSERYLEQGAGHFEYLKKKGLKPEHMFLDYGCGVMRLGTFVGKYLNPGNYVGVDISRSRLTQGGAVMASAGIPEDHKNPDSLTTVEHLDPFRGDPTHVPAFQALRSGVGEWLKSKLG